MKQKHIISLFLTACLFAGCASPSSSSQDQASQEETSVSPAAITRPVFLSALPGSSKELTSKGRAEDYTLSDDFANVLNKDDIAWLSDDLKQKLRENYFVATSSWFNEFYEEYESNEYSYTPSFVTVDSLMHTYHLYYAFLQKTIETTYLRDELVSMSRKLLNSTENQYEALKGTEWESAVLRNRDYFSIALSLLGESVELSANAEEEIRLINEAGGIFASPLFSIDDEAYLQDYTQFLPRGYYTESEALKQYFKAMMWYGQMNFSQKDEDLDRSALLMILALEADGFHEWENIYTVTAFFAGESDDCGYYEYAPAVHAAYGEEITPDVLIGNDEAFTIFYSLTSKMEPPKINSMVVVNIPSVEERDAETIGYRLMGQRFTLDAMIFQNLTYQEVKENSSGDQRRLPDALDIPAAMGSETALALLKDTTDAFSYENYAENMQEMRKAVEAADDRIWSASVYSAWLYTLKPLLEESTDNVPKFMQSEAWARKNLGTYLGSYTELKHDSILYAKQVMAEMGGIGFDEIPDDRGYVEPQPEVFYRLADLAKATSDGLNERKMISATDQEYMEALSLLAEKLGIIAEKELNGELPNEEEFDLIRSYGGQLEHLWLRTVDDGSKEYYRSYDNPAPIVADIATDPQSGICLEVATGHPATIYVAVYFDGAIRIARGSIFSFYSFEQPITNRLTDEAWREKLDDWNDPPKLPEWLTPIYAKAN